MPFLNCPLGYSSHIICNCRPVEKTPLAQVVANYMRRKKDRAFLSKVEERG